MSKFIEVNMMYTMLFIQCIYGNQYKMEELDALLRDLETNYPISNCKDGKKEMPQLDKKPHRSGISLDISDILNIDLEESQKTKETIIPEKVKCYPVFISGTKFLNGCSNLASPRRCSSLHCRNCDFKISQFENFEWTENTDYLFLRTNMPKLEKVITKLRKKNGSVAYACHCVSYSTEELYPVNMIHSLSWFCRGHEEPQ